MPHTADIDVIVGGGGVAGLAAAAAIQQLGYQVMLVEPGLNDDRRLAGEVFHPPGVARLAELGLLRAVMSAPAVTVEGFSVSSDGELIRLPYDTVPTHRLPGLCLEHTLIRQRMRDAVSVLPNIMLNRARVVGVDQSDSSSLVVDIASEHHATSRYRCRMLVAADGTSSRLARMAGIGVHNRRISTIWAYRVDSGNLPQREYGHVFLGAGTPILLYPIGHNEARILFDVPYRPGERPTAADCLAMAAVLPAALRRDVEQAIAVQPRLSVMTQAITAERSVQGRVVLVGDAGGCCHPLTATGMSMCVSDALLLREALAERRSDLSAALQLYQRRRRWPQATRLALADTLREALCGTSPEMRVVRSGILAYWRDSAAGRSATLALLSTADGRPLALVRGIIAVMVRGFLTHLRRPLPANHGIGGLRVAQALLANFLHQVKQVLIGPTVYAREQGSLTRYRKPGGTV
jgi:squalene monooxygenase